MASIGDFANRAVGNVDKAVLVFPGYVTGNGTERYSFTVQYNPNKLVMNTKCESTKMEGGGIVIETIKPETNLQIELIFDQVNNKDAFLWEKFSLSLNGLASTVGAVSSELSEAKRLSVKKYVETLLACTHCPYTTFVTFIWGKMQFTGELQSVVAKYTMFNFQGEPIRAVVSLKLQDRAEITSKCVLNPGSPIVILNDTSGKTHKDYKNNEYWEKALNDFLGSDSSSTNIDNNSAISNLSAILNL